MNDDLTCHEIAYDSDRYRATVALRFAVLRAPLGLQFSREQLESEYSQRHFACYEGENLVACVVLAPATERVAKMRQLAVAPQHQRRGIGRALVEFAERAARDLGFTTMVLHARETAVPFYEKLGYRCEGERFEEVRLPHRKMSKELAR